MLPLMKELGLSRRDLPALDILDLSAGADASSSPLRQPPERADHRGDCGDSQKDQPMHLACLASTLAGTFVGAGTPAGAETKVTVGCSTTERIPLEQIDHSIWDRLLKQHSSPEGRVDYAAWHKSTEDTADLDAYLANLSRGDPGSIIIISRPIGLFDQCLQRRDCGTASSASIRRQAFATTRPAASGRATTSERDLLLIVADKNYSLEAIESEMLRPLGEKRVHFPLVSHGWAARGSAQRGVCSAADRCPIGRQCLRFTLVRPRSITPVGTQHTGLSMFRPSYIGSTTISVRHRRGRTGRRGLLRYSPRKSANWRKAAKLTTSSSSITTGAWNDKSTVSGVPKISSRPALSTRGDFDSRPYRLARGAC